MRSANRFDLADFDISAIDPPANGEHLFRDSVAMGLALRIRASGARTWILFGREHRRTARETLGEAGSIPLATARRMAVVKLAPVPDCPATAPLYKPSATVAEVFVGFLAHGAKGRWKSKSAVNTESIGRLYLLPTLGHRKVAEISPEEVARWYLAVSAGRKAGRNYLTVLSQLMAYAEDHGLRPSGSNPCRGLRKKQTVQRGAYLPDATIKRLWRALDQFQTVMPTVCDAVRLLLLTGARKSEVLGLTWDRIIGPRAVLDDSKTGPQTLWLNAPARALIEARRQQANGPFLFPAKSGEGPLKDIYAPWLRIVKAAGLARLRIHDLRHHYASTAVSNGIDLRLIGQLLGHADIESTLCYAHLATGALVKSASRVSDIIDRSTGAAHIAMPLPKRRASRVRPKVSAWKAVAIRNGESQHA